MGESKGLYIIGNAVLKHLGQGVSQDMIAEGKLSLQYPV